MRFTEGTEGKSTCVCRSFYHFLNELGKNIGFVVGMATQYTTAITTGHGVSECCFHAVSNRVQRS